MGSEAPGAAVSLTTPQRNCLLAIFRAHPAAYEVRGAAQLPLRLCSAGLVKEVGGKKPIRRFQLTEEGLGRATRLAARRLNDRVDAVIAGARACADPALFARAGCEAAAPCRNAAGLAVCCVRTRLVQVNRRVAGLGGNRIRPSNPRRGEWMLGHIRLRRPAWSEKPAPPHEVQPLASGGSLALARSGRHRLTVGLRCGECTTPTRTSV